MRTSSELNATQARSQPHFTRSKETSAFGQSEMQAILIDGSDDFSDWLSGEIGVLDLQVSQVDERLNAPGSGLRLPWVEGQVRDTLATADVRGLCPALHLQRMDDLLLAETAHSRSTVTLRLWRFPKNDQTKLRRERHNRFG